MNQFSFQGQGRVPDIHLHSSREEGRRCEKYRRISLSLCVCVKADLNCRSCQRKEQADGSFTRPHTHTHTHNPRQSMHYTQREKRERAKQRGTQHSLVCSVLCPLSRKVSMQSELPSCLTLACKYTRQRRCNDGIMMRKREEEDRV